MKVFYTLLLSGLLSGAMAQCPDQVIITPNQICLGVLWFDPPAVPPETIYIGESIYLFAAGVQLPGASAVYSLNGEANSNPFVCLQIPGFFTGTIYVDGEQCDYNDGVLPVTIASFDVTLNHGTVLVEWETSYEYENDAFLVQRSTDGLYWENISEHHGRGNADYITTYSTTDHFPESGTNLYRLVSIDKQGVAEYSGIRQVSVDNLVKVFPNPASQQLTIRGEYVLYDFTGRVVTQGMNDVLDISNYARGVYLVRIDDQNQRVIFQ